MTIPPVTWIMLFSALANSISTSNSISTPSSVTQLNEFDVPPPSCSVPPSIANDFEAVTLITEVYGVVNEHTYRVSVPLVRFTLFDANDCTELRVNVTPDALLIIVTSLLLCS
jgi:hypothetical protein